MVFQRQRIIGLVVLATMSVVGGGYSSPTPAGGGVVSGTVTYRERLALPPDAVVEAWLADVSQMDVAAPVVAETTFSPDGRQVPLPFTLRYNPADIEPDRTYAVRAVIRNAGRLMFTTDRVYPVITLGNPTHVELLLVRVGQAATPSRMGGTTWLLEDLGGTGVLDRVQATLAFPEAGKVAGNASCNRFFGSVELSGTAITFGALGTTRRSCAEAVMTQERRYLRALAGAERFTLDRSVLLIDYEGSDQPLRFTRLEQDDVSDTSAFRAVGTEPFWGLTINRAGLRFTTPDNPTGLRFPLTEITLAGDAVQWVGKTKTAVLTTRLRPGRCSDGMSDRAWTHHAVVRLDGVTYRGCAEPTPEAPGLRNVIGKWVIIDHRIPGISAMTHGKAARWHGRTVRFGKKTATSHQATCRQPRYRHRTALANTFLKNQFRVAPADLGLRATARLELTEVLCAGARWAALGGRLLRVPEGRFYTVWDGVFFKLQRLPDNPRD